MWWTSTTGGIIPSLIILIAVIVVFRSLKNNMGDNARYNFFISDRVISGNILVMLWKNMFYYFDKYIYQFEQIHFAIWTNTLVIWRNTFGKLDKNILQ